MYGKMKGEKCGESCTMRSSKSVCLLFQSKSVVEDGLSDRSEPEGRYVTNV
jgi:hypothetical protein